MKNKIAVDAPIIEPVGHIASNIHRMFLTVLNMNLAHIDIDRFYYPILLIEASRGNLTQQELAGKLGCDKVQVVRIIDYLSEKGYVTRVQNTHDRRKYGLEITEKAKKIIPDIKKAIQNANALVLNNLSEKKIYDLYSTLKTIEKNLSSFKSQQYNE
ncbi:MAG: MarR family transcriptional regulator [Bacteroidales bacterium]|jgi:DNA-binding MarR family transcriptional regulator